MTRNQAEKLLSELRTRETAVAADMASEWDQAWYVATIADYDERAREPNQ